MIPRTESNIHVFDFGTVFSFQVVDQRNAPYDIAPATLVEVLFMRPDGSNFHRIAEIGDIDNPDSSNAEQNSAFYISQDGDFDMEGQWYCQLYTQFSWGAWHSSVISFTVLPNLMTQADILTP